MKRSFWIVLCLLVLAGAWYFWPRGGDAPSPVKTPAVPAASIAPAPVSAATTNQLAVPANVVSRSAASTNREFFRLSNTTKTVGELTRLPHAILLENAMVDTDLKLALNIPKHLQASGEPGAYLVQARGLVDNAFRSMLAGAGAQIVSYIPNNAYLVQMSAVGANALATSPLVQAVLPYQPYYKVQSSLLAQAIKKQPLPSDTYLTLGLFPNGVDAALAELKQLGATVVGVDRSPFGPIVRVRPPVNWVALAQVPGVQRLEPTRRRVTANDLSRETIGVSYDSIVYTNYLGLDGNNVLVEVNDTGIDPTHPDLIGRVLLDNAGSGIDTDGHGTFVAGQIAGDGTESLTVTNAQGSIMPGTNGQFRGMAPMARLFSVGGVGRQGGAGLYNYADRIDLGGNDTNSFVWPTNFFIPGASIYLPFAKNYTFQPGAFPDWYFQEAPAITNALISNNSWNNDGAAEYDLSTASYDAAVRDALPEITGPQPVLFVFSAGNRGFGNNDGTAGVSDTILSPATAKNVITVGALEQNRGITNTYLPFGSTNPSSAWFNQSDSSQQVAGYSSRGNVGIGTEGTFGRFKPDVVAPGSFVVSTRSTVWNTNAYYNPTNHQVINLPGQLVDTNLFDFQQMHIPTNTIGIILRAVPNNLSPVPFPTLAFYVTATNAAGLDPSDPTSYDFSSTNNTVTIPPDGNLASFVGSASLAYFVTDYTNTIPVSFDLIEELITTNDNGSYNADLQALNDSLGQPPQYYRYESGTSMAAADVSGVLALMQGFFTNTLHTTPSPALLKALLINGARIYGNYQYSVTNGVNDEGWGLINLPNSIPAGLADIASGQSPLFFVDQSPTNSLATGDSRSYAITVPSGSSGIPLRVTLTWTDPPGNPAAALKLVNNLDLVVSNTATGDYYVGNNFDATDPSISQKMGTNSLPLYDTINNVENVVVPPGGTNYVVTVIGRGVNVNAVTTEQTNIVQDFALVVSSVDFGATNALTVSAPASVSATVPLITGVGATNGIIFNQLAGASAPWLSTNYMLIAPGQGFGTNAAFYSGQTNQWHFYVVTNTTPYANAAFITFIPQTLAIPREGVFAGSDANATRPEADLDLFVAAPTDAAAPGLTNLDPLVISNCVYGVNGDQASLARGGTKFLVYSNSAQSDIYYVGVKCEDQMAGDYGFIAVFSPNAFSTEDTNGNVYVNGLNVPLDIPDGNNQHPGVAYVVALAIPSDPAMTIRNVVVSNTITHDNFYDLVGSLTHDAAYTTLNNHDDLGAVDNETFVYNDGVTNGVPGGQPSAGPGSLLDFRTLPGLGLWLMTEIDDSQTLTGRVDNFTMKLEPHMAKGNDGVITVTVPAGGWFYDFLEVPVGCTNIAILATNITDLIAPGTLNPGVELYLNYATEPTASNYLAKVVLNQGTPPGNSILYGPPVMPGLYYIGLYNPDAIYDQTIEIRWKLSLDQSAINKLNYDSTGSVPLLDDAVTYAYQFVTNIDLIQGINVGLRVDHERISDLVFHLVSPDGTRYLLMENRGGQSTNGCGASYGVTNTYRFSSSGTVGAVTNVIQTELNSGTADVSFDFGSGTNKLAVYYDGSQIFTTGPVTGSGTNSFSYGPGLSTSLICVINPLGDTNYSTNWNFTVTVPAIQYSYLTFTEDTNLTTTPIKFAVPPFVPGTNLLFANIQTNYGVIPTNIPVLAGPILNTNNGHYYYLFDTNDWTTSEAWAVAIGGHLTTINDAIENNWVMSQFSLNAGVYHHLWIGLYDTNNDVSKLPAIHGTNFSWVDGEALTYTNYRSGEPNNGGAAAPNAREYFVYMFSSNSGALSGLWNDYTNSFDLGGSYIAGVAELDALPMTITTNYSSVATNLYYQPEQSLEPLIGTRAFGEWTLEILDNRIGATNNASLVSWQLQFTFANTNFTLATITNGFPGPSTNYIPGGGLQWFEVDVPTNADFATNTLIFADLPLNMWWSTNVPPTITNNPPDTLMLAGITNGAAVLGTNGSPVNLTPPAHIEPGGTYYLGIQNPNIAGANYAVDVTFHLILTVPTVITEPATNIMTNTATLEGLVTPNGGDTTVYFDYGTDTNYLDGPSSSILLTNNYFTPQSVGIDVSNLLAGTLYHFRVVAYNIYGTNYGDDLTFRTLYDVPPPYAFTAPATLVNGSSAQLNGFATPNGYDAQAWFEWGTSPQYTFTNPPVSVGTNFNVVFVDTNIFLGLNATNQPFHYRLVVSNEVGITYGFDQVFAQGSVVTWGSDFAGQTLPLPPSLTNLVAGVGAGYDFSLALNFDGTVVGWGDDSSGQTNVPAGLNNAVAVSGGYAHALALRSDRTVTVWGDDSYNQTNTPSDLTNAVAAVSGAYHCLALRDDGNPVAWGRDNNNQTNIPAGLSNVVAVAAGFSHSLALKNDGTVVAWGNNALGQTNVPAGLTNVVAIAAGHDDSLALRGDGTVVAWGSGFNQTNVPASLTNVTAITAGYYHCQALKGDGSVWFWGDSSSGQLNGYQGGFTNVNNPGVLTNVFAISGGGFHTLSLQASYGLNVTNLPPYWTNGLDGTTLAMDELTTLSVTNSALDSNSPPQLVFYSLATNAPAWATIDSFSGVLTFNPLEADGPSTNVIIAFATDNGYPPLSSTNAFTLVVNEVNTPPVWTNGLPPSTNYTIGVGQLLTVTNTASDSDIPTNTLTYTNYISPAASGLTISTNGIITWTPSATNTYTITTVVTDSNPWALTNQMLSATNYITVTVTNVPTTTISISSITYTTNSAGTNGFLLTWYAPTNDVFQVQWEDALVPPNWQFFTNFIYWSGTLTPTNGLFTFFDDGSQTPPGLPPIRFYRIILVGSLPSTHTNAVSISSVTTASIGGTNLTTLGWTAPTNYLFEVRWTTNLAPPTVWAIFPGIISSGTGAFNYTDTNTLSLMKFYQLILLP